jgi:hypothetical protein
MNFLKIKNLFIFWVLVRSCKNLAIFCFFFYIWKIKSVFSSKKNLYVLKSYFLGLKHTNICPPKKTLIQKVAFELPTFFLQLVKFCKMKFKSKIQNDVIFKGACFKLGGIKRTQLKIKNMKIK